MKRNSISYIFLFLILLVIVSGCVPSTARLASRVVGKQAAEERQAQLQAALDKAISTGDIKLCEELKGEGGIYTDCLIRSSFVKGDPSTCSSISDEKTKIQCEAFAHHDSHYIHYANEDYFECGYTCRQMVKSADSDLVNECEGYIKSFERCYEGEDPESCLKNKADDCDDKSGIDLIGCLVEGEKTLSYCKDTYLIKTWLKYGKLHKGASKTR